MKTSNPIPTTDTSPIPIASLQPGTPINIAVPLRFRWPIEQVEKDLILVRVPTAANAPDLVTVSIDTKHIGTVSDAEYDLAVDCARHAAFRAAVQSLAIIR